MAARARAFLATAWTALGGKAELLDGVRFAGEGGLASAYPVTDMASAAIGAAALALAELAQCRGGKFPDATIDRRLASFWFAWSIRPVGWEMPAPWDPIAGDYQTTDGWIRLHTNAPHHRAAAVKVLGQQADKAAMKEAVAPWKKQELEEAIVQAGGCAAEMRSVAEWAAHPQGRALASEPLAHIESFCHAPLPDRGATSSRPLAGVRVLDLTRVLAGPVASRFLAGFGADVLRLDPPDWDEPGVIPEVTLGKRCARLDLKTAGGRTAFEALLSQADVILHGYRGDALDRLGYDAAARRQLSPGVIDVSLCAYGWSGPWALRRGFDSLVQMSIADAGMRWKQAAQPTPLPVQALDHGTGYLLAAAVIRGVTQRLKGENGLTARLSLARTAKFLTDAGPYEAEPKLAAENFFDFASSIEGTGWGNARRLKPPVAIRDVPLYWTLPASPLGASEPVWS
jgi:crotonobetainyl-CoA:carnitine CoA-transferase CaiB-like acyl-CoA transferase